MNRPVSLTVVSFLLIISALHVLRLVLKVEVIVGGTVFPQWVSIFGILVPGGLAVLLNRERSR